MDGILEWGPQFSWVVTLGKLHFGNGMDPRPGLVENGYGFGCEWNMQINNDPILWNWWLLCTM